MPSGSIPRLNVIVGKGGVGRTTVATAMGLASVRRGRDTLIVEVSLRQAVPELFDAVPRGYEPTECVPGLRAIRVTWEDALREYGVLKLKFRSLYRMVFENPFIRRILPAIPGVAEILVIGKILYVATDGLPDGSRPEVVILDAPATGHGISLLAAPFTVGDVVPSGPMAEDARRLRTQMLDRRFARFHIVTTPEEMPVAEGIELYEALHGRYGLEFGPLIVNGVQPGGLTDAQARTLRWFAARRDPRDPVATAARAALFVAARERMQRAHIARLTSRIPIRAIPLPDVSSEASPRRRVERLADHLGAMLWTEEAR